jgi:hypothetical protein
MQLCLFSHRWQAYGENCRPSAEEYPCAHPEPQYCPTAWG